MSYYRRNRSGNKKIFFRILFVLMAALVITVLSVFLGVYLQHKVDAAEELEYEYPTEEVPEAPVIPSDSVNLDTTSIYGAGLDLKSYSSADEIVLTINQLADYYNTLTLPLTDAFGTLIYTSPGLCEALRMPIPQENALYELISSAVTAARAKNMRVCGLLTPATDFIYDHILVEELTALGFDEILFTPDFGDSITYVQANDFRTFLNDCKELSGTSCSLGVLLSSAHYIRSADAKHIQMIASAADFLGVSFNSGKDDTTTDAYRTLTGEISSIMGSFSLYHMRVILNDPAIDILSAKVKACIEKSIYSISLVSPHLPGDLIYSDEYQIQEPDQPNSQLPSAVAGETNPYSSGSTYYPSYQQANPDSEGE